MANALKTIGNLLTKGDKTLLGGYNFSKGDMKAIADEVVKGQTEEQDI